MFFLSLLLLIGGLPDFSGEAEAFLEKSGSAAPAVAAVRKACSGDTAALQKIRSGRRLQPVFAELTVTDPAPGMRLYRRTDRNRLPLLIYLHGGGWTWGSIHSCARFCGTLAANGTCAVLAADYPLSPEHPYPAALQSVAKTLAFARAHAAGWGCDPDAVSLGGDSSGGNLAVCAALKSPEKLRSLVLFYPVVKAWNDGSSSWKRYRESKALSGDLMEAFNRAYLGHDGKADNIFISPALAPETMLRKLPPVLLIAAERDILHDQGKAFSGRLTKLGVPVNYLCLPGTVHLFITVPGQEKAFQTAVKFTSVFLAR